MTENKPIMIDEVDVSRCDLYFHKCQHKCEGIFDCDKKPNCYFKQLARKTQECERLKYDNDYQVGALERTIDSLQSEKEQIKKYLGISSKTIMERLEELQEFRDRDRDKLYKAEQKLERMANKLMRIEKIVRACESGYTDEFIQSLLEILSEPTEE